MNDHSWSRVEEAFITQPIYVQITWTRIKNNAKKQDIPPVPPKAKRQQKYKISENSQSLQMHARAAPSPAHLPLMLSPSSSSNADFKEFIHPLLSQSTSLEKLLPAEIPSHVV